MNPELNPREQQARAVYLQNLYRASGRTNGLYTGLYQECPQTARSHRPRRARPAIQRP